MDIKTRAIVLRTVKYGDQRIVADLLTEQGGRLSFMVTLSKNGHGKMRRQLFQPLSILQIESDIRPTQAMQRLRNIQLGYAWKSLPFAADKTAIGLFLAEFLCRILPQAQQDQPLFDYVEQSLEWLDMAEAGYANFHLVFMMRLTRFLGIYPNTEDYHQGDYFDLRNGTFSAVRPIHSDVLQPEEAALLGLLLRMNFATMHLFRMSRQERNRCAQVLLQFYRLHTPAFGELKSLPVLQQLFASD